MTTDTDGPDMTDPSDKLVINLSDFQLEQRHKRLLSKGLKFCPRPSEPDPGQMRSDLDSLHKRLRLSHFFEEEEETTGNSDSDIPRDGSPFKHREFKKPSNFNPPGPPTLEAMILANEENFNSRSAYVPPTWDNISKEERLAIRN